MHSRHARRTHAHLDDAAATVRRSLGVCAALLSLVAGGCRLSGGCRSSAGPGRRETMVQIDRSVPMGSSTSTVRCM